MLASKRQSYQVVSGPSVQTFLRSATLTQLARLNAHGHGLVEHGQQNHGALLGIRCLVDRLDASEGAIIDDDLVACGSVAAAREKGLYRMEGKEYVVKDGDVLLFKFNV